MSLWNLHEEINFAYDDGFIGEAEDIKEFGFLKERVAMTKHLEKVRKNMKNLVEFANTKNITTGKILKSIKALKEYLAWNVDWDQPYSKEDEEDIKKNYNRILAYLKKHNYISDSKED